ncbi:MAG TPA: cytosolic protein, partial [Deltaproteobacteria bacterium]|nr:cytosolic protein [Deltaproteobacteria bacterium]
MTENRVDVGTVDELSQEELVKFAIDGLRRIIVHYGFWFKETEHQLGLEKAFDIENNVWKLDFLIQMKRLSKLLGFEIDENGIPVALKNRTKDELIQLISGIGVNWLANDGVWFQAVEKEEGMFTAKRCNDTCWTRFSPYEAYRIKEFLGLPREGGGLKALKQALSFRLYARINVQSFEEPDENTLIFRMNEC